MSDDFVVRSARQFVSSIEALAHAHGWDQPPSVWELHTADAEQHWGEIGEPTAIAVSFKVGETLPVGPDLSADLVGRRVSDDAIGAVLVCEVWGYGAVTEAYRAAGGLVDWPPELDPARRDVRFVQAVLRDSTEVFARRVNGAEPEVFCGVVPGAGPLLVRRVAGVASRAPVYATAGQVARRALAAGLLAGVRASSGVPQLRSTPASGELWAAVTAAPTPALLGAVGPAGERLAGLLLADSVLEAVRQPWPAWEHARSVAALDGDEFARWADAELFAFTVESEVPSAGSLWSNALELSAVGLPDSGLALVRELLTDPA